MSGGNFSPSTAGVGTYTITYTYTDGNFCTNTATATIYVDACTGLSSVASAQEDVIIYPNPTKGEFTVYGLQSAVELIVYNLFGEKIVSKTVNRKQETINLSGASGIYFLQVKTENGIVTRKIIKE